MLSKKSYYQSLIIICILFFVFGFLTWLNGVLIPYFQICLELTNFQASLVVLASFGAYFVMAIPSAWVLKRTEYKKGMTLGLIIMAVGTVLFIPAAYTRAYPLFLLGLFITGTGLTLLQAAANPYIAIIGPIESTAQRVGYLGISNKMAGIFSIMVLGSIFLLNADEVIAQVKNLDPIEKAKLLDAYALKIVNPYIVITICLLLMAVFIHFSGLPEIDENTSNTDENLSEKATKTSVLQFPNLVLGILALFFASACEVIPIDSIILYARSLGMPIEEARQYPTYSLFAMLFGYLASILFIPKYISQNKALLFVAIWGILLAISASILGGKPSIYCLILTSFGTAILWGTIWGLALKGLGQYTKIGGALLLMAIIGGAVLPVIFGRLIDIYKSMPQRAIILLIPFYVVIFYYSVWGHRKASW